jgi:hypothetical protein
MTMVYRCVDQADPTKEYLTVGQEAPVVATVRIVGAESVALFKEMVRRANNCWDTAPVEMKQFSDHVTEGMELQKYHEMPQFREKERKDQ